MRVRGNPEFGRSSDYGFPGSGARMTFATLLLSFFPNVVGSLLGTQLKTQGFLSQVLILSSFFFLLFLPLSPCRSVVIC